MTQFIDPDLTYPEGRKHGRLCLMACLDWHDALMLRKQSINLLTMDIEFRKKPRRKDVMPFWLDAQEQSILQCAMTSLVMTRILDEYMICNTTPEGKSIDA